MEGRGGCGGAVEDPYKQAIPEDILDLPPGFRFHPTDEEVITHYLTLKVLNPRFAAAVMAKVDLNKCEPWDMPGLAKFGEKDWYFFCQKDRKYPTGTRTNRATCAGYWKATGKDKDIYKGSGRNLVGMKKTLVFYTGRAPKGSKTNWVMHEFRLEGLFPYRYINKDEWVVCRVFNKTIGGINNNAAQLEVTDLAASFIDELLENSSSPPPPPPLVDHSNFASCSNSKCEHHDLVEENHPDHSGHFLITTNQPQSGSSNPSYLPRLSAQNCPSNPTFSDPLGNSDHSIQRQMGITFSEGFKIQAHHGITKQFSPGYTGFSGGGGTGTVVNKETSSAIMSMNRSDTGRCGGEGGYYGYLEGSLVDAISDYDGLWDFESFRKS